MKISIPYRYSSRTSGVLLWLCFAASLMMYTMLTIVWFVYLKDVRVIYYPIPIGFALHIAGLIGATASKRFCWWFAALCLLGSLVLGAHAFHLFSISSQATVLAGGVVAELTVFKLIYRHMLPVITSGLLFWRLYARAHAESQELAREVAKRAQEVRDEREKKIFRD